MDGIEEEDPMPDESLIDDYKVNPFFLEDLMYKCGAMKLLCPELADHDYAQGQQFRKDNKNVSTGNGEEGVASGDTLQTHEPPALEMVDKPRIDQPRMGTMPAVSHLTGQRSFVSRGPIDVNRQFQSPMLHSRIPSPQKPTAAVRMTEIARPDPPPHRMVERSAGVPSMPPRVRGYNSPLDQTPQQIMGNGNAPIILASRGPKPVKRGSHSRGKKDDNIPEGDQMPPPVITAPPIPSPRKAHFPSETMHMPQRVHEDRFHHEQTGAPQPAILRSHPVSSSIKSPMRNVLPSRPLHSVETAPVPAMAHMPIQHEDPNPLPDSIIDDTPDPAPPPPAVKKDESEFPSHLAEIVMNLMPDRNQAPEEPTDASVKERISRIAKELEKSSAEHQKTPTSADNRGRQKSVSRPHRTVSTSSMSSSGMPPFTAAQSHKRANAGLSPVRTNLDFNSHLKSDAAHSTSRDRHSAVAAHNIPRKEMKKTTPKVSAAKKESPKKRGRPNKKLLMSSDDEEEEEDEQENGEWDDEDYTTRCICGFEDNYGGMVECEKCQVWQHFVCLDLVDNADSEGFLCEMCDPKKVLPFTPAEANRRMRKLLGLPPRKQSKPTPPPLPVMSGRKSVSVAKTPTVRKSSEQPSAKNTYTKRARQLMVVCGHGGVFAGNEDADAYEKMMVEQGVEGLVATKDIAAGVAVVEIVGNVCIPDEAGATEGSFFNQFVFVYDGIGDKGHDSFCVDARKQSSDGRFVRRCCRPNASIQHKFNNGIATFFVVTREKIAQGAEITIPFDFGYRPLRNTGSCRCAKTDDLSSCLLSNHTFTGPGHRFPVAKTPTEQAEKRKVSRSKNDEPSNNNTPVATPTPKVSREEKSEEESAVVAKKEAQTPVTRQRGKTVGAKRGSDKEEPKADADVAEKKNRKDSISEKRAADLQKTADAVKFVIHHNDKNTMNREERKLQALMSRFDPQNEAKANQKKKEFKKEEPKAQSERRRGRTVSSADTRKRRNTDSVSVNDEPVTPRAASPPPKKLRHDSERSTMPAKKGWMARHEAQSSEKSSSSDGQPSPKKHPDAGESEVANVLAQMHNGSNDNLRAEMRRSAVELQHKLKEEEFKLPQDMHGMMKAHKEKVVATKRSQERTKSTPQERAKGTPKERAMEVTKERPSRETPMREKREQPKERTPAMPKPSTSQVTELVKEQKRVETRRLSFDEYKKRKASEPTPSGEPKPPSRIGFIPVMTEDDVMPSLPPLVLPRENDKTAHHATPPAPPRAATRSSTRNVPPPPPPRPVATVSAERPAAAAQATPPSGPASHSMSLADRLAVEFGIGTPSNKSDHL